MTAIRAALAELVGMFIDDGRLALTLIALIAVVTLAVKIAVDRAAWPAALCCSPAASLLLLESVYRDARRKAAKRDEGPG